MTGIGCLPVATPVQVLPDPLSPGHTISPVTKHDQPKIMGKQSHHQAITLQDNRLEGIQNQRGNNQQRVAWEKNKKIIKSPIVVSLGLGTSCD